MPERQQRRKKRTAETVSQEKSKTSICPGLRTSGDSVPQAPIESSVADASQGSAKAIYQVSSSQAENTDLILWNKLGSNEEILNSEVGVNGVIQEPIGFAPVQHGNGVALKSGTAQVKFDEVFGDTFPDQGTIEFWWIPAHDENSSTGSHYAERALVLLNSDERRSSGTPWPRLRMTLYYRSHGGSSNHTNIRLDIQDDDTGEFRVAGGDYDLNFLAGQKMHVGIVWNKDWGIDPYSSLLRWRRRYVRIDRTPGLRPSHR